MELSGATTANWVAKSANLLVDGLGGPARVGLVLPLHWQAVVLVLAGVTAGASVRVAETAGDVGGCDVAFTTGEDAEQALAAGVGDVLALSCAPLGTRLGSVPPGVEDFALEVPAYGDTWSGAVAGAWDVQVDGADVVLPQVTPGERLLVVGGAALLPWVLGCLATGGSVVLAAGSTTETDAVAVCDAERVSATAGVSVASLARLDG